MVFGETELLTFTGKNRSQEDPFQVLKDNMSILLAFTFLFMIGIILLNLLIAKMGGKWCWHERLLWRTRIIVLPSISLSISPLGWRQCDHLIPNGQSIFAQIRTLRLQTPRRTHGRWKRRELSNPWRGRWNQNRGRRSSSLSGLNMAKTKASASCSSRRSMRPSGIQKTNSSAGAGSGPRHQRRLIWAGSACRGFDQNRDEVS